MKAVNSTVINVYVLWVLKRTMVFRQTRPAINKRIGFMKFEPRGVDEAKIMSPTNRPTIRQTASGPFVIKPVSVPIPLVSLRVSIIISMEIPIRSISKIIPLEPMKAIWTLPSKRSAEPQKKRMTSIHTARSKRPTDSRMNSFMRVGSELLF